MSITYASIDLLRVFAATQPDKGRPVVLLGARGLGKSHLLAAQWHAMNEPDVASKWLSDWAVRLGHPGLNTIKFRTDSEIIAESLHQQRYKFLWDILFDRHPHGKSLRHDLIDLLSCSGAVGCDATLPGRMKQFWIAYLFNESTLEITMNRTVHLQLVTCLLFCFSMHSLFATASAEQQAQQAAEHWLALSDDGKFAENWKTASTMLQQSVSQEKWSAALDQVRKPLGALVSRKLSSAKREKSLPGAPDGDYVVMQFQTSFANKKEATETVTAVLDKEGTWKIAGYFIK